MPRMGDLARVRARRAPQRNVAPTRSTASATSSPGSVAIPLRLVPSPAPWRNVTATWIPPRQTLAPASHRVRARPRDDPPRQVALTDEGRVFAAIERHRGDAARHVLRRDPPEPLHPRGLRRDARGRARGPLSRARRSCRRRCSSSSRRARARRARKAFSPLETALLEAHTWAPVAGEPSPARSTRRWKRICPRSSSARSACARSATSPHQPQALLRRAPRAERERRRVESIPRASRSSRVVLAPLVLGGRIELARPVRRAPRSRDRSRSRRGRRRASHADRRRARPASAPHRSDRRAPRSRRLRLVARVRV